MMLTYDPERLGVWTSGRWVRGQAPTIRGFSIDTRTLQSGELFVALKTEKRDGHDFLPEAQSRGAAGALVSRVNSEIDLPQLQVEDTLVAFQAMAGRWRQQFAGPVIGITGSCGKTSTKELLARLLGRRGVYRTEANFNNHLGVPLSLLKMDPVRHCYAVIEVGASARGEVEPLAKIVAPTHSIVTGVAPVHLEGFATLENIAREKAVLGRYTRPEGCVIFPECCYHFDPFREFFASSILLVPEGTSGTSFPPQAQLIYWTETRTEPPAGGCHLALRQPPLSGREFELPRGIGPGMTCNAALAIVMATLLGVDDSDIQERLRGWKPARCRGEILCGAGKYFYVDCYNANPASMAEAFAAFVFFMPQHLPRLYVLGGMAELGERSHALHYEVGKLLPLRIQDKVLLVGQDASYLREGLLAAGNCEKQITIVDAPEEAGVVLRPYEGAVLLKGSRIYHLETFLPEGMGALREEREVAC